MNLHKFSLAMDLPKFSIAMDIYKSFSMCTLILVSDAHELILWRIQVKVTSSASSGHDLVDI